MPKGETRAQYSRNMGMLHRAPQVRVWSPGCSKQECGAAHLCSRLQHEGGCGCQPAHQGEARGAAVRGASDASGALGVADHTHELVENVVAGGGGWGGIGGGEGMARRGEWGEESRGKVGWGSRGMRNGVRAPQRAPSTSQTTRHQLLTDVVAGGGAR